MNQELIVKNVDDLVENIKRAASIRNMLCHGAWNPPDEDGKSLPSYINRRGEKFETRIDIDYLTQIRRHVRKLACAVINSVTENGFQFPSSSGPGKSVW